MKRIATIIFLLSQMYVSAQNMSTFDYYNRFKSITPTTPEASALINLSSFPHSNYTGVPDIKIPIYSINLSDFSIPIVLSYNASGIKVEDIPSWVGSGWSLDLSGMMISRIIQGSADDKIMDESGSGCGAYGATNVRNVGYLLGGMDSVLSFNDAQPDELKKSVKLGLLNGFPCQNWDDNLNIIPSPVGASGWRMDMQPDFFFINILGRSYKLFFKKSSVGGAIRCFTEPYSTFKIDYTIDKVLRSMQPNGQVKKYSLGITAFNIVDGQGNKYVFDLKDSVRQYVESGFSEIYERGLGDWSSKNTLHTYSSWYLTNIITANNDTINFNYQAETYETPYSKEWKIRGYSVNGDYSQGEASFNSYEYSMSKSYITSHRLVSIATKEHLIQFTAGLSREDLTGTNALTDITVTSKISGQVVKKFKFAYDYFVAGSPIIDGGDLSKRLKLLSFKEMSPDESITNPYAFTYYETPALPPRNSKQQDFWGYYNGNGANTLIPIVYAYPNYSGIEKLSVFRKSSYSGPGYILNDGAADRNANANTMLAGTLKQIQHPSGGTDEYTFEANEYNDNFWSFSNKTVGGLRIKKIIKDDKIAGKLEKEFLYNQNSYVSSGKLLQFPYFAHIENTN